MRKVQLFLAALACSASSQAIAIPTPPPPNETVTFLEQLLQALRDNDVTAYQKLMSPDVRVYMNHEPEAVGSEQWITRIKSAFEHKWRGLNPKVAYASMNRVVIVQGVGCCDSNHISEYIIENGKARKIYVVGDLGLAFTPEGQRIDLLRPPRDDNSELDH